MTEFHVIMPCGTEKDGFDTYSEAESGADTHADLCDACGDGMGAVIEPVEQEPTADGGPQAVAEPGEAPPEAQDSELVQADAPGEKPAIDQDPVDWLPGHFVDTIQGVPTLNRKGYAVMCERFGVSVTSTPVTLASETGFEYAEFRATAVTEDGTEYSGMGSAHVDRGEDGNEDDSMLLNELAETRAMKRAASWATGLGMTAASELTGGLNGE